MFISLFEGVDYYTICMVVLYKKWIGAYNGY